ncbi:MAG: hypothetical protein K2X59_07935 [Sphingomonas sp.]|nr:hypothetical protein [Sphingomonas sp.]
MRSSQAIALGVALFVARPAVAFAVEPKPLDRIGACRSVADDAKRLACFDQAAAALEERVKAKDVVVVDRESLKQDRRRQFGLVNAEDPTYRAAGVSEPAELKGKILWTKPVGQFHRISVEGAGVWETTEYTFRAPVAGGDVVIRKGALGSYKIQYGHEILRIRRLQ